MAVKGKQGLLWWSWLKTKWLLGSASTSAPSHSQFRATILKITGPGLWMFRTGTCPRVVILQVCPRTSSISIMWRLVRNTDSRADKSSDRQIRNSGVGPAVCISTSPPGNCGACLSLTTVTVPRTDT